MHLLLPSELKHRIAELSSQDTLASLARTHTTFQREAEQALYRTLSNPPSKCLETLATNSEKAGFVHFLSMVYSYRTKRMINDPSRAPLAVRIGFVFRFKILLNALVNMRCLSDLRLRLPGLHRDWIESLDIIIWSVY